MKVFGSCLTMLIFLCLACLIGGLLGGFTWPYAINTCLAFADKAPVVTFKQGFLIGLVPGLGHLGLPFVILVWIASLFIL